MTPDPGGLLNQFRCWAEHEPAIVAVTLFGSRARNRAAFASEDEWSDIDLQVVTSEPHHFYGRDWTKIFASHELWAYAFRPASGGVGKVTAVFNPGTELDVVVVSAQRLRFARLAVNAGLHRRVPSLARALNELATVMRGGHRVLKGGIKWERFYARVVAEVTGTRLNDTGVCALAEEFVCDYVWIRQKLNRGEHVAAQRVLHRSLVEINFRLLHEFRLRNAQPSFREARRVEGLLGKDELELISISASRTAPALSAAVEHCASSMRRLTANLIGVKWCWPKGLH